GIRLIPVEGALPIGETGNAARKDELRRAPIYRILIVSCDARSAGDIHPVFKIGYAMRSQPAEFVSSGEEKGVIESVHPIDVSVQPQRLGRIYKTEEIRTISPDILKSNPTVKLVF